MIQRDYLIVGGGIGAASACDALRQHDPKGTVTLVSNEAYLPYHRPALSKSALKDGTPSVEKLVEKSEDWYRKRSIELRLATVVREFNIERRLAVMENGQTIEFRKACLATGSRARRPHVAGANLGNVVYLRTYRDVLAIVVIGTEPNLQLVTNTPLSSPGGCPVNEYLESDEKGIYAVGDIALYPDKLYGGARRVTSWDMALVQGATAGANMTGRKRQRLEVVPLASAVALGMQFMFVGDFSLPHLLGEIEGSREKGNFIMRYRRGEHLVAAVLCNRKPEEVRKLQEEVRTSMQTRQKK